MAAAPAQRFSDDRRPRPASWFVPSRSAAQYDPIASHWQRQGKTLRLDEHHATVYVPAKDEKSVRTDGGKFLRMENGTALYEVDSGRYSFTAEQ